MDGRKSAFRYLLYLFTIGFSSSSLAFFGPFVGSYGPNPYGDYEQGGYYQGGNYNQEDGYYQQDSYPRSRYSRGYYRQRDYGNDDYGPYSGRRGGGGTFIFNPRTHSWVAIINGRVIRAGRASGGKGFCPDTGRSCRTPSGVFYVQSKGGPECRSTRYPVGGGGAKMPYCMFFTKLYAIHGSYDVPNYNASHGCIRVTPSDALWLTRNFIRVGTRVVVKSY